MVNKPKAQGSKEEKRQRDVLLGYGFKVDRLAEEGMYDKGDYIVRIPTGGGDIIGESKHMTAMNIHEAVAKAKRKADGHISFVWWKRSKRKGENKNRSMVGKPIVCMSEEDFIALLSEVAWPRQYGLDEGPVPPIEDLYKISPMDVPFLNVMAEDKDRK